MQPAKNISVVELAEAELAQWQLLDAHGRKARITRYWNAEKPRRNWCAAFACYLREQTNRSAPAAGRPRRGARACVHWVADRGVWVVRPGETVSGTELLRRVRPGDVVCWRRGVLSWTAHVGTVTGVRDGRIHGIEGNVKGAVQEFALTPAQLHGRLKGLYAIARAA